MNIDADTDTDNLIELSQWKNRNNENSFTDYIKVLSFNDLLEESNELMGQAKRNEASDSLFAKTRVIMNEFSNRLEIESRHLAESVRDLKKQIEDKLH